MWETQCDHFSVAWAIIYRDSYGYYPCCMAGPVLNSKAVGQGPVLVDKRICNCFCLALESSTGLFWKPLGFWGQFCGVESHLFFHPSKDIVGLEANLNDRMLASHVKGHEFHTQQCDHSIKTRQNVDI